MSCHFRLSLNTMIRILYRQGCNDVKMRRQLALHIVPPLIQDTTSYNLRNAGNIQNYRVHTNFISNSFFPSTVRAWNDLPNDIKDAPSVASFKYKINKSLKSPPKFYNAGTRKGQLLQARLPMECSSLNSDLHRKNIVPNPFCRCGVFESRIHFFFACPIYSLDRLRLSASKS